jgi:hypothetical protein
MSPAVRIEKLKSLYKQWMKDNEPSEVCEQEEEAEVDEADEDNAGSGSSPTPSEDDEADGAHVDLATPAVALGRVNKTEGPVDDDSKLLLGKGPASTSPLSIKSASSSSSTIKMRLSKETSSAGAKHVEPADEAPIDEAKASKTSKRRRKATGGFGNVGEDESGERGNVEDQAVASRFTQSFINRSHVHKY